MLLSLHICLSPHWKRYPQWLCFHYIFSSAYLGDKSEENPLIPEHSETFTNFTAAPQQDYPQVILILGEVLQHNPKINKCPQRFKKVICSSWTGQYTGYPNISWKVRTKATNPWSLWNIYSSSADPQQGHYQVIKILVEFSKQNPPIPDHSLIFKKFTYSSSTGKYPG